MCATATKMTSAKEWPNPADFSLALQAPRAAFRNRELWPIEIARDACQQPRAWAGQFANVYKGTFPDGRKLAVRVFVSARSERRERYQVIYNYLKTRRISPLVEFTYEESGVRSARRADFYPLITMEWVSGETLYEWVRARCLSQDRKALAKVADLWVEMIQDLNRAQIAHGDLQHGNVMITERGELKLVDYDCMCVPELVGLKNLEIGVDPYQHPQRDANTLLSLDLDNFSALFVLVALKALAAAPELWMEYVEKDHYDKLLFRREDLRESQGSALIQSLYRSPDAAVGRLCKELVGLVQANLDRVPRLEQLLFSFTQVETFLDQREFDQAVELLTRGKKRSDDAPPPLQPRLREAEQRIQCRVALEQAVRDGDETAIARFYVPQLLDDYPKAEPSVAIAKKAAAVIPVLQQLQNAERAQAGRDLVRCWDAHQSLLAKRKSAERFAPLVSAWRHRNQCCDLVLRLVDQLNGDPHALEAAWQNLLQAGGHPETDRVRPQIEKTIQRHRAWAVFCKVPATSAVEADTQLLAAWNEPMFAGWSAAERERPRLVAAKQRLELLQQLRDRIAETVSWDREKAINRIARDLPADYFPDEQSEVKKSQHRLGVVQLLSDAFKRPDSDLAISGAWAKLGELQARAIIPVKYHPRILLAEQRQPLIVALKKIPAGYPVSQAPQLDAKLLAIWKDDLLHACNDAQPWLASYEGAAQRRDVLVKLEAAISGRDKSEIARLIASPCLRGYPISRNWSEIARRAQQDVAAIQGLICVLESEQREQFLQVVDARLIRDNPSAFAPYQQRLREWLPEEVLPTAKMGLSLPLGRKPLTKAADSADSYRICWSWPDPRFCDQCLLAVCRNRPSAHDQPLKLPASFRQWVDRRRYEEGSGSVPVNAKREWGRSYVVLWASMDMGFETFFSEPLILGTLGDSPPMAKKKGLLP
jgi:tRNA A-37 threonylcarbamoyl transferase component Bud32